VFVGGGQAGRMGKQGQTREDFGALPWGLVACGCVLPPCLSTVYLFWRNTVPDVSAGSGYLMSFLYTLPLPSGVTQQASTGTRTDIVTNEK
jgi:hypothetical protein